MTEEEQIIEIVKETVRRLNINGAVRKETIIHEAIMKAKNISSKTSVIKSVCLCTSCGKEPCSENHNWCMACRMEG